MKQPHQEETLDLGKWLENLDFEPVEMDLAIDNQTEDFKPICPYSCPYKDRHKGKRR